MHCEWTVQQALITTQCVSSLQPMLFPFFHPIQCSHSCFCWVPLVCPSKMTEDLLPISIILRHYKHCNDLALIMLASGFFRLSECFQTHPCSCMDMSFITFYCVYFYVYPLFPFTSWQTFVFSMILALLDNAAMKNLCPTFSEGLYFHFL